MDCLVYGRVGEDSVEDGAVDWLQGWVQDHRLELHGDWITVCIYLFLLAIVWRFKISYPKKKEKRFKISWLTVPWEKNNMVSFMRISCKASTDKIVVIVTLKLISWALLNGAIEIFLGWSWCSVQVQRTL